MAIKAIWIWEPWSFIGDLQSGSTKIARNHSQIHRVVKPHISGLPFYSSQIWRSLYSCSTDVSETMWNICYSALSTRKKINETRATVGNRWFSLEHSPPRTKTTEFRWCSSCFSPRLFESAPWTIPPTFLDFKPIKQVNFIALLRHIAATHIRHQLSIPKKYYLQEFKPGWGV